MKKLINLLTSFSLFTLATVNVVACMDNGKDAKKKRTKKIVVPHDDNEENEEDGLLALEMEEKIDKLSLISINAKTTANGINKISDLIEELKTNKTITDITEDVKFKITANEEEAQLLQPLDYQLTIQLLKSDDDQSDNDEDDTVEDGLKSADSAWTTTFKVNVNNELSEEDKNQFNAIFTAIEQKLNTFEFLPAKIITVIKLEETLRSLIVEVIQPFEKFALVKIENKSERFKANDHLYQNGEGIDFNVILKTKYNKTTFDKTYNINLKNWDSWDIIKYQYVNEIKEKLFEKIGSLNKMQIDNFQPLLEKEIETLSSSLPKEINHPFTLNIWKQVCKLLTMGIDPLSEEQLASSENDEIKTYSFAEWKYLKSTLFQTFYFKEVKDIIVNFKNKFKGKIDITFKFQQQVDEKIYTYDQSEKNDNSEISVFKYNKTDNSVIYPTGKSFSSRLIAIVDGQEYEAPTPWKPFTNLKWVEDCYYLPTALIWAVNNYFNSSTSQEEKITEK